MIKSTMTKKFAQHIVIYGRVIISFSLFYIASFKTPLFAQQSILFYRGTALLACVMFAYTAYIIYKMYRRKTYIESYIAATCIAASGCLVFFVLIPVTVDRSISTYILHTVQKPHPSCLNGGMTKEALHKKFVSDYVDNEDAVGRRLNEQLISGTLRTSETGCWEITERGRALVKFFTIIKGYFDNEPIYGTK